MAITALIISMLNSVFILVSVYKYTHNDKKR